MTRRPNLAASDVSELQHLKMYKRSYTHIQRLAGILQIMGSFMVLYYYYPGAVKNPMFSIGLFHMVVDEFDEVSMRNECILSTLRLSSTACSCKRFFIGNGHHLIWQCNPIIWYLFIDLFAIISQVLSGCAVIVRGQPRGGPPPERQINLSNIRAGALARRAAQSQPDSKDIPDEVIHVFL